MNSLIRSFGFALKGIICCLPGGTNFKIQLVLGALTFILGVYLNVTTTEWLVLIMCSMIVLSLEMLNTAIEKLCNMITTDFHPQVKVIKDVAAGSVLVSAAGSCIAGLVIFLPKIFTLINYYN